MSITMNLYYTGENGSARKFAEEMEESGTAAQIREKYDLYMRAERYVSDNDGIPDSDSKFIKK